MQVEDKHVVDALGSQGWEHLLWVLNCGACAVELDCAPQVDEVACQYQILGKAWDEQDIAQDDACAGSTCVDCGVYGAAALNVECGVVAENDTCHGTAWAE
jgi:hypothetical protein